MDLRRQLWLETCNEERMIVTVGNSTINPFRTVMPERDALTL